MTRLPSAVKLVEVGPRDGLQNEAAIVPTDVKVALVRDLVASGLPVVEVGSFVSPKWVPQMADTAAVLASLPPAPGVAFPVLVPNMKGLEAALAAGAAEIAIFAAASESFSQRNINCSIAESFERFAPVAATARERGVRVRGYVSCVVDCPYEGAIAPAAVAAVARRLLDLGCYEVSLGETIGTATPGRFVAMLDVVAASVPRERLALHCHDTYGQAVANVMAGLERGVAVVDAAVSGLGGCPYAKGAAGNVATEDVLFLLDGLGVKTGVALDALAAAGRGIMASLGRASLSKTAAALAARLAA